jgi:DNA polymerase III epsilon subunit-like protein
MLHLNGNLLCAIDCETTGLYVGTHEICEICILPLDGDLKVRRDVIPFNLFIKPEKDVNVDSLAVSQTTLFEIIQKGMDKYEAADLFQEWYDKLKLPEFKRISPLAHNWPFDREFIREWLGVKCFEQTIDGRFRDTMSTALAINDLYDRKNEMIPYPKVKLSYIASCLKLDYDRVHNALDDCVLTAKVYRELLRTHGKEVIV